MRVRRSARMGDFSQAREIDSTAIKRYSEQAAHANHGYNVPFCASRAIPLARQAVMYHLQEKRFWRSACLRLSCFPTQEISSQFIACCIEQVVRKHAAICVL